MISVADVSCPHPFRDTDEAKEQHRHHRDAQAMGPHENRAFRTRPSMLKADTT
jgi:hypothetical protein